MMNIDNVKPSGDGYIVNGTQGVPGDQNNRHAAEVLAWIAAGGVLDPEFTAEDLELQSRGAAQDVRDAALLEMEYDFGDGRVMQTRPQDEVNVRTAIEVMTARNIPSRRWVMKDNVKHPVTVDELETALAAGQLAAVVIWDNYEP